MPDERAAKPIAGIAHTGDELRNLWQKPGAALKVNRADDDVAYRSSMTKKAVWRRGKDDAVVLRDDVINHRKMGRVVKHNPFLAVVDIEIIGDHMLAENKPIAKTLHGNVVQYLQYQVF